MQEFLDVDGPKYKLSMTTIFTYDPFDKIFHVVSIDKKFSYADVFEGYFNKEEIKLVDNMKRGIPLKIEGKPTNFQLSWQLIDDEIEFLVKSSIDNGNIWKFESKIIYSSKIESNLLVILFLHQ